MERIWLIFTLMLLTLPAQAAIEMYYLHNDHLGTPRVVTNQQKEIVWKGHLKPFGEMEVEVEAITNHRRFPGQRFDIESRLYYNYFRDYDPSLGRYIQSDPIGLDGGLNTYAYVGGNPLNYTDEYGLLGARGVPLTFNDGMNTSDCRLWCVVNPYANIGSQAAKGALSKAGALGKALGSRLNLGVTAFSIGPMVDCMGACEQQATATCYNPDQYNPFTMTTSR